MNRTVEATTIGSFVRNHSSAILLVGTCLLGVTSFITGFMLGLSADQAQRTMGTFMLQLGGSMIAVALTALFFNLPDMKEYLSQSIFALFASGTGVKLLSEETREALSASLMLERLGKCVTTYEPTLMRHISTIQTRVLQSPYVTNYHYAVTIYDHTKYADIVMNHTVLSYRMHVHHLADGRRTIPLRYFQECILPKGTVTKPEEWIVSFKLEFGPHLFTNTDLELSMSDINDSILVRAVFVKNVELTQDTDMSLNVQSLNDRNDPVELVYARYPSQGFQISMTYSELYVYDCAWFLQCDNSQDNPPTGRVDHVNNGIHAKTNEWVMPGEGVMIYYAPKRNVVQRAGNSHAVSTESER